VIIGTNMRCVMSLAATTVHYHYVNSAMLAYAYESCCDMSPFDFLPNKAPAQMRRASAFMSRNEDADSD
jgi:hypothetical protein